MKEYLIGIDVGGTNIKILIMDLSFNKINSCSIRTEYQIGYDKITDNIIRAIERMFLEKSILEKKVLAVGMGLPGIVDKKNQTTVYLSLLQWNGFNPCKKIADYFDAKAVIDNDANINALGECYFGLSEDIDNMVLLTLGTGVGSGVIIDGKIYGGAANLASELGHMTIVSDGGEMCLCGRYGHMEAYCSGTSLMSYTKRVMEEHPETILHQYIKNNRNQYDNRFVTMGVKAEDQMCIEIWNRFVYYLSVGVANVMKLFNPELILIGGGISGAGSMLVGPVNKLAKQMVIHERQYCPVKIAYLGSSSGMYGACAQAAMSIGMKLAKKRINDL